MWYRVSRVSELPDKLFTPSTSVFTAMHPFHDMLWTCLFGMSQRPTWTPSQRNNELAHVLKM